MKRRKSDDKGRAVIARESPADRPLATRSEDSAAVTSLSEDEPNLRGILESVREACGIDFAGYNRTSVLRRIARRMAIGRMDSPKEYAECLRTKAVEASALGRDMLIHVTSFFRDEATYDALKVRVLPEILRRRQPDAPLRIWVPGCSTGEEVYSIAICLLETLGSSSEVGVQIFGSDVDEKAIGRARSGNYTAASTRELSAERLARFFVKTDTGYRIAREVRKLCTFAKHDVTRDPPFARLDLISCRNVLIYFGPGLQERAFALFHHCLKPGGYLLLGNSESIADGTLFHTEDRARRLFRKPDDAKEAETAVTCRGPRGASGKTNESRLIQMAEESRRHAEHLLLARYAPPTLIVDDRLQILEVRGHAAAFLEPPSEAREPEPPRRLRPDLLSHLQSAIEQASAGDAGDAGVRRPGVCLIAEEGAVCIDLEVIPLAGTSASSERCSERSYLVLLEPSAARQKGAPEPASSAGQGPRADREELSRLTAELGSTREYLRSVVDEHRAAREELSSTNDELVSGNEELLVTNEELEAAREELQSSNEEFQTVNDELRRGNRELDELASDLVNVLDSVSIPLVIVDEAARIRRFTPNARAIANLIPGDVGRPLEDIRLNLCVPDLVQRITEVLQDGQARQWEVQTQDERWHRLQIRAYLTHDGARQGAVVALLDIHDLKQAKLDSERNRDYARAVVELLPVPVALLDVNLRIFSANRSFCDLFALAPSLAQGLPFFDVTKGPWKAEELREAFARLVATGEPCNGVEAGLDIVGHGRRVVSVLGRRLDTRDAPLPGFLVALRDITEQKGVEFERASLLAPEDDPRGEAEAEDVHRQQSRFIATISHELRTPLTIILLRMELLCKSCAGNPEAERACASVMRAAKAQAGLIENLLDIGRLAAGKVRLDVRSVDFSEIVRSALGGAHDSANAKSVRLIEDLAPGTMVMGDSARLTQIAVSLLNNALKRTPSGGTIRLDLGSDEQQTCLCVTDTGGDIDPGTLSHLFDTFNQPGDASMPEPGFGLSLAIVRQLVDLHGGTVHAENSRAGRGGSFSVRLPRGTAELPAGSVKLEVPADGGGELAPSSDTPREIRGIRILVVDDDGDSCQAQVDLFSALGAEVCTVGSADEALGALAAFRPDVLLCDILLAGGEDGISLIRSVRSLPPEKGGLVPAAAVTGLEGGDDSVRAALGAGYQVHLSKPVDTNLLIRTITTLAGREGNS